jgi:hypothetical protein
MDVRLFKSFELAFTRWNVFLRVYNLFDVLNQEAVFDDTGDAGFTTDLERIKKQNTATYVNTIDEWFTIPTNYSEPRRIELGVTIDF